MAVLTDGRTLVWSSHKLYAHTTGVVTSRPLVWPADATVNGGSTHYGSPGTQVVVWATPADGDYIYSSGENKHVFRGDGTHAWSWLGPGCCDFVQNAAYDPIRNHLLNAATYNALATLDANTGSLLTLYQPIVQAYQPHHYAVAGDNVFHVGGNDNIVAQQSLIDGAVAWSVDFSGMLASGSLFPGAVAGDGTIVVGSSGGRGRIMRLNADGTINFSVENGTSTAPVISETAIYVGSAVGTTFALQSYDFDGDLRWSVPVAGAPTSLLVGDDGLVFASLGGNPGQVIGARESDGSLAVHFVNVEAGGELMLRDGRLLLKTPNRLYSLPVGATNYPAHAPWPVQRHDNFRSSARSEWAPMACPASDACHVGVYDTGIHACTNRAAPDGTICDDGNASTVADACAGGSCLGSNLCAGVICGPSGPCHLAGTCDPRSGICSNPIAADGTVCSDGNACTAGDVCRAGGCEGGNPITCIAAGPCETAGACDPSTGTCLNEPIRIPRPPIA
ncbi:MAG: PQQ-binding-like beta-propeller repeat protein, partial [Deltaproteobacteria bacterium]|nr:PQQ-binding-like beta-propeller repeat protein [Deltaproteobacteria bacterium]